MRMKPIQRLLTGLALALVAVSPRAAEFPVPYNSEPDTNSAPMLAVEAVAKFKAPPGFKVSVFAAEPDVQNPIAMAWDARGRLWVAENYTYAERAKRFDLHLRDRALIFEDKKGDGHFSSRKVFTDDVQMLTSIEVGHGGVWLMCPPQLLFIPDKNGDDIPDGAPEVVLDGFTVPPENYHNFSNGLRWGPDGWLYGRCGASAPGEIGAPGAPARQRIPMRGTMWRYHPQRKIFEAISSGCTNPWGHDWDEHGELFFINTVNGHLWHGITGAHFVRPHTIDPNPRAYEQIDQHADHWHFDIGKGWNQKAVNDSRNVNETIDKLGGGHAHIGAMIYLGDNWPAEFRGHLFTWNMHGRRANQEILERSGSGYVGRHGKDMLLAEDPWFRGMELSYGPDGGVFALDWSDTGECHDSTGVHRTSGRIYKITHGEPKQSNVSDLTKLSARELVKLHLHPNEWFVRQARLELAGRAVVGGNVAGAKEGLVDVFEHDGDLVYKLRALWTLYGIGAVDEKFLGAQLHHQNEHVRAWAVRLLSDAWPLDTVLSQRPSGPEGRGVGTGSSPLGEFVKLAKTDSSALVRLSLASTLQRLPASQRAVLAAPLLAHAEDAQDYNLPLMIWYGLIPVADTDPLALAKLAAKCELPRTRQFIARRLAEDIEKNPAPINELLKITATKPEAFQSDVLLGVVDGLAGWRKAKKPATWEALARKLNDSTSVRIRDRVRDLNVLFGDGRALGEVKRIALDAKADVNTRRAALQTLIESRPPDLRQICEQLLNVRFLNTTAVRGLAQFDDPAIGEKLAKNYRNFHHSERAAVIATLVSRPAFAKALLSEMAAGKISLADVTPFHARQIRSFNDPALTKLLGEAWGELRESAADKRELVTRLKAQLTPEVLAKADKTAGRVVFNTACAACHTLYGHRGAVGPDLTGAGRDDLDYLLENIADPSAVVNADFRMWVANLKDGQVVNGLVSAKTDRTVTLKTMTEVLTLERSEIKELRESALSIMPEGLLEALNETQTRDLIAYLMHRSQVPLPAAAR